MQGGPTSQGRVLARRSNAADDPVAAREVRREFLGSVLSYLRLRIDNRAAEPSGVGEIATVEKMKKKVFYGWWIVLATNITCMLGYGTWLYSFGVFFKPMIAEFGWTRAMTAAAYSLRSVEGGLAAPVVGWAVDKYRSRAVIQFGAVISGLGFVMMYFVDSLTAFYFVYAIWLSIGMSAMLYIPANAVIARSRYDGRPA
jgi:hypothetical protein